MTLKIKVQVDRLPDVTPADGSLRCQLGIRVSAVLESDQAATTTADAQLLQPWRWRSKDDPATAWNAHDAGSWMLWRYDGASMSEVPSAICTMSAQADPDFDQAPRAGLFRRRISEEIDDIIATYGVASLEAPGRQGIISGRTVYGLVESLTALPSPVPACMHVWTAVALDSADLAVGPDDQFFAIPLFGTPDVPGYGPPAIVPDPSQAPDTATQFDYAPAPGRAAAASVFPSLSANKLSIPPDSSQLIDLASLLVRPGSAPFEGSDWSSDLALRIAETLDPSARLMSVLDEVVRKFARQPAEVIDPAPGADPAASRLPRLYREVLAIDLGLGGDTVKGADYLRKALAAVHWQVVGPRTHSSRPTAAPAASFIERLAGRSPQLWSDAMLMLLAQAAADTAGAISSPGPMVLSRSRLADAAGIVVARKDMLDEPDAARALDNESAFRDWLADHWTTGQPASTDPASESSYLFAGLARDVKNIGGVATAVSRRTGLIDLMRQPAETELRIPLSVRLGGAQPESLEFRLGVSEKGGAAHTVSLHLNPFEVRAGGQSFPLGGNFADGTLVTLVIARGKDAADKTWKLGVGVQGPGQTDTLFPDVADISTLAVSGKLMLAVSLDPDVAGSFLRVDVGVANAAKRLRAAVVQGVQPQAMRAGLALAYSGPVIAGIMGGWVPVDGEPSSIVAGRRELSARLADSMSRYIDLVFGRMEEVSVKAVPEGTPGEPPYEAGIRQLLRELWSAARADATQRAEKLIPSDTGRGLDRVTPDAIPLSFAVDELQDFDDTVDLWTRLAGLGVLIGRDDPAGDIQWWSLNAASLHAPQLTRQVREQLSEANAVVVDPAPSWEMQALVDPVPLVVTESQGVRNAVIHYESQSIVAEVQKRPQLDPQGKIVSTERRPEAYLFPVDKAFPKLPPLTFGRTYHILPYLIGHGGALPPVLRGDQLDPTSRIERADPTGFFRIDKEAIKDWLRERPYLRTVPVAAPRLSDKSRVPGLIEGVESLAAELPVVPPAITLKAAEPTYFFIDRDQVNGLLSCPVAGTAGAGIRIEIAGIDCNRAGTLTLSASQQESGAPVELVEVSIDFADLRTAADGAAKAGIRIEIIDDQVSGWALFDGADALGEDEPLEGNMTVAETASRPVSEWRGACVALSVSDDMDIVPPSIRWGRAHAKGRATVLLVEGDKPLFPAELVPQSRSISILDGIGGKQSGPTSVLLAIKRPTASMATYDRWINGAISKYGSASDAVVRAALNDAAARTTRAGGPKGEKVLDDPAVQALVVEVIQLFPTRRVVSLERLDTAFHATAARLMGDEDNYRHGTEQAFVAITVAGRTGPSAPRAYPVTVQPGCSYEIRIYGALAKDQPWFAPISNRARFAPSATAGWRDVTINGVLLHLGAPLVHTVEVAADLMPELYSPAKYPLAPFFITMQRPPMRGRDMAAFHLLPTRLEPRQVSSTPALPASKEERYQALRMVDRLALIEQRWSWRGRPHPELGPGGLKNFGERGSIDDAYRDFCDMAFLGRSHDDIGPIKEKRIARHHVFGGSLRFPERDTAQPPATLDQPIFLESELDYRGGANLWRFAVRAKSRYAAMRNDSDSMLSFSHTKQSSPKVNWTPLLVPDRVHPNQGARKPKRPGLMLVVPLTEPMSAEGTVPPLLALFNEPMFPLFHAGDGIEAVIEVARHPYPGLRRIGADDASRKSFTSSWEQLETLRKDLQTTSEELRAMQAVDAPTGMDVQEPVLQKAKKQEQELREAVEWHCRMAGTAMALAYTKKWEELAETLWGEVMELEAEQAATLDPVKKDTLSLEIQRFKERYEKLKPEIAIAKSAEPHGHTRGADSRAEGSPLVKYWPEFAPDPVRTGAGADGTPVAMRCDGPIGYGFDFDVQAGRFDHAGLLISPVGQAVRPWSMVKMRFRRLETPEFLVDAANLPLWKEIPLPAGGADQVAVALSSSYPDTLVANAGAVDFVRFNTPHEGLAIDLDPGKPKKGSVKISLDANPGADQAFTQVDTTVVDLDDQHVMMSIAITTQLGTSKAWTKKVSRQAQVDVRLIVSRQFTMPDVPPRGDVSVRVRITPGSQEKDPAQADEHAWLSVICTPLTASATTGDGIPLVYLHGGATSHPVKVRPVRLSEFTDGVWCQFAAAMSRVVVSAVVTQGASKRKLLDTLAVTDLVARRDKEGKNMSITLRQKRPGETVSDLAFATEGQPDAGAQLEECLFAVVTRYIYDAFDRLRECPNSIHPMNTFDAAPGSPALGAASWTNPQVAGSEPFAEGKGRIRILRVLRGKKKVDGGFEAMTKQFPQEFFGAEVEKDGVLSMNPFDGAGQVLGISQPFEWE